MRGQESNNILLSFLLCSEISLLQPCKKYSTFSIKSLKNETFFGIISCRRV